jgi:uncharacterized membrane protein YdbT with pleckstrin-like domain
MAGQRTPHLARLLGPAEAFVHVVRLHPLYGWHWVVLAVVLAGLAYITTAWLLVPAVLFFAAYRLPFITNEMAVTTHRLLLRIGGFTLVLKDIVPEHLDHYRFQQNALQNLLGLATIVLVLRKGGSLVELPLPPIRRPLEFVEALGTLNPHLRGAA